MTTQHFFYGTAYPVHKEEFFLDLEQVSPGDLPGCLGMFELKRPGAGGLSPRFGADFYGKGIN